MTIATEVSTRARDEAFALYAQYQDLIARMLAGEYPAAAPWNDPRFQKMVVKALAAAGKNQRLVDAVSVVARHLRDAVR